MKKLSSLRISLLTSAALTAVLLASAPSAFASPVEFPSCLNYTGNIQAQYSSGFHAIVGNPDNQEGADTVYELDNSNFMQCFCPLESDNGTQTNWLRADSLSEQKIQDLQSQGWVLIENGADWGLEPVAYLAQNIHFSCGGNPGNTGGPGGNSSSTGGSPMCQDSAPQNPYVTSVQKLSTTSVLVSWQVNPGTNDYSIVYGTTPGNYIYGVPSTGNVTSYTISNLDSKATYYFAVRAANGCASSNLSNESAPSAQGGQILSASLAPTGSIAGQLQVAGASILSLLSLGYGFKIKKNS